MLRNSQRVLDAAKRDTTSHIAEYAVVVKRVASPDTNGPEPVKVGFRISDEWPIIKIEAPVVKYRNRIAVLYAAARISASRPTTHGAAICQLYPIWPPPNPPTGEIVPPCVIVPSPRSKLEPVTKLSLEDPPPPPFTPDANVRVAYVKMAQLWLECAYQIEFKSLNIPARMKARR